LTVATISPVGALYTLIVNANSVAGWPFGSSSPTK